MSDDLWNSHEDRLQRVEAAFTTVSTGVAEVVIKQNYLSDKLDEQTKELVSQLHSGFSGLHDTVATIKSNHDTLKTELSPLFALEKLRKTRWEMAKKGFLFVLAGTGGVFVTALGKELLKWLTNQ